MRFSHPLSLVALVGALPAASLGAEIYGVADKELWDIQSICLSTMVPVVSGRDRRLALVLGDDPTWRLTAAPIIQFCKEVWWLVSMGHDPGRGFIGMRDLPRPGPDARRTLPGGGLMSGDLLGLCGCPLGGLDGNGEVHLS